jgi:NADH-quinone oxidoreductase subunit C
MSIKKNYYNFINFIIKTVPAFLDSKIEYKSEDNVFILRTTNKHLLSLLSFLKNNQHLQFKTLISITATDFPQNKNRFELSYFLLSYKLNTRLIIKLSTNDTTPVNSIVSIYKGAN